MARVADLEARTRKEGAASRSDAGDPSEATGARKGKLPAKLTPQLATLVKDAPDGEGWLHEIKYDGYRLLCRIETRGGEVRARLQTRNGNDWTPRFPPVAGAAAELPVEAALLDGEAVVLDEGGRSDFQALQNALGQEERRDLIFYAFDLLHLDGVDLLRTPLEERKTLLATLLEDAPSAIRYSGHLKGGGRRFHREACRLGLEGIVSKRADRPYTQGRGRDWLKTKCLRRQEMVVVGWTEPRGSRTGLGSLVLGVNDDEGRLVYSGRVGTGFTRDVLRDLRARLEPLGRKTPPVEGAPRSARGRTIHWVSPKLVAEIAFTEWTEDGAVRHPVFQGLREDKAPDDVVREKERTVREATKGADSG